MVYLNTAYFIHQICTVFIFQTHPPTTLWPLVCESLARFVLDSRSRCFDVFIGTMNFNLLAWHGYFINSGWYISESLGNKKQIFYAISKPQELRSFNPRKHNEVYQFYLTAKYFPTFVYKSEVRFFLPQIYLYLLPLQHFWLIFKSAHNNKAPMCQWMVPIAIQYKHFVYISYNVITAHRPNN